MRLEFLQHSEHKNYAKDLYEDSFPLDERRVFEINFEMIETKNFDFFVVIDSSESPKPIGIISLWYFRDYIYIEHFAIDKKERLKGYGKEVIKNIIDGIKMPVIIEIEPPNDIISEKRIEFYKGLGFDLLNYHYTQPPYSKEKNPIELNIMVYDKNLLAIKPIDEIVKEIHRVVYEFGL